MSCGRSAAYHLEGLALEDGWSVLARDEATGDHTGGAYSVGYVVAQSPSGLMGYLKAFDYSEALEDVDPARALERLTAIYNAERELLELCGSRSLRRIVRALAAGNVRVDGFSPNVVSFLILELADSDSRDLRERTDPAEHMPILRLAHNAAVSISQLHSIGATHQDIKPSNFLVWMTPRGPDGKLGDLGCAHMPGRPSPFDGQVVAGDCSYASPEQLYNGQDILPTGDRRFAADMYMLGNLAMFLFTGVSHSGLLHVTLDRSLHWKNFGGSIDEVMPALVDAHGIVLGKLEPALHSDIRAEVVKLIDEMCYPDPRHRGDRVARKLGHNPFAFNRYVTRLDLLYKRAAIAGGVLV